MLAACVWATSAHAGDVCKGVKTKADKFGGGSVSTATLQSPSQLRMLGMSMQSKSGADSLTVIVKEGGAVNGVIAAGSEMMFSFSDGTVLTLATATDAATQSDVQGSAIITYVSYTFDLTEDHLKTMAGANLSAIRVPIVSTGQTYDWDANKSVQKSMLSVSQCFLQA